MRQSNENKSKSIAKSLTKQSKAISNPRSVARTSSKKEQKSQPVELNAVSKLNFDIMSKKQNITQIGELKIKYVLKCIGGLHRHRFLYITTHKQGQIIGSGNPKEHGLTLQIEGVGLDEKHAKIKFSGFKKFYIKDFQSRKGTWVNIPNDGMEIKDGSTYLIGPHQLAFQLGPEVDEIEQVCMLYEENHLGQLLTHNNIKNLSDLFRAQYEKFKDYPFSNEQLLTLNKICQETKEWYDEGHNYRRINLYYLNQPLKSLSIEVGWCPYIIPTFPEHVFTGQNPLARIKRGKLIPEEKVYSRIQPYKNYKIGLHDQIKLGDLIFELQRFNMGIWEDIGHQSTMEDYLIVEEDVGGSEWKLISFFAVIDGYGGNQCAVFIKKHMLKKIQEWIPLLDSAGDLNQMVRLLMYKTFYELDYAFYQQYSEISMSCGATVLCALIIDSRVYIFNLGDCKGYLYREDKIYQLNIDHLPSRGDEKLRIEKLGGFVQYNRLMGKCALSRAMGQFELKQLTDYQNSMKGKLKSFLSCTPEVIAFDIQENKDDYILLMTDGMLSAMDEGKVIDYINQKSLKLDVDEYPDKIISSLMENCKLINPNCDNMAAVLIYLKRGKIGGNIAW